jgi:hypothetical protein
MSKEVQDFDGEFAEERALLHAADVLKRKACESIRKKITPTIKKYIKNQDLEGLDGLVNSIPDCVEKFYTIQAIVFKSSMRFRRLFIAKLKKKKK